MLYSEFVENTGCKETDYNYTVYKRLELVYMNDNTCTKEWIYEAGKKLVDNSLTEEQKRMNEENENKIAVLKAQMKKNAEEIKNCREIIKIEKAGDNEKWYIDCQRSTVKFLSDENAKMRREIEGLKESIVK